MVEVLADDLVENAMLHAALYPAAAWSSSQRRETCRASVITCFTAGGQTHINIRIPSKLVSKSVLAALMCMNESLSASETVCVCMSGGLVRKTEGRWVAALIHNKTLESICVMQIRRMCGAVLV